MKHSNRRHALMITLCFLLLLGVLVSAAAPVARASADSIGMGSLTGYVKDAFTGLALRGAQVGFAGTRAAQMTKTDAAGSYTFPMLPAGPGRVGARATGYVTQTVSIKITENQLTQAPDLQLAPLTPMWNKIFGNTRFDDFFSVAPAGDGGYVAVGLKCEGCVDYDGWALKLDANGNTIWDKTFGGSGDEQLLSVQPTPDGGYIAAGAYADQSGYGGWVLKLDADGNQVLSKNYGDTCASILSSIVPLSDGGYVAAGTAGSGTYLADGCVIRIDPNGNLVWDKTFGGSGDDWLMSIATTNEGSFVAAGRANGGEYDPYDGWVIKLDANGNQVWSKTLGGSEDDRLASIALTSDGAYLAAGFTASSGAGGGDGWVIKLDTTGNELWSKTLGGNRYDELFSLTPSPDGGTISSGRSSSFGDPSWWDGWVVKMDANGDQMWSKDFGPNSTDQLYSILPTADRGYIGAGSTGGITSTDGWAIKMDANGNSAPNPPAAKGETGTAPAGRPGRPGQSPFRRP